MRSLLVMLVLVAAACGDNATNGTGDAGSSGDLSAVTGSADLAFLSRCGHAGDVGNSVGVGRFCTNQGPDCTMNGKATTCSALFNGSTPSPTDSYFCSFQCLMTDPAGSCGDNAECLCASSGLCACIPVSCAPQGDGGA